MFLTIDKSFMKSNGLQVDSRSVSVLFDPNPLMLVPMSPVCFFPTFYRAQKITFDLDNQFPAKMETLPCPS